jgi:hypothetical protein
LSSVALKNPILRLLIGGPGFGFDEDTDQTDQLSLYA